MAITEEQVREALKPIEDPELHLGIVDLGLIYGVDVNPVSNRIYVANLRSDTVSVIDGSSNTVTTTIAVRFTVGMSAIVVTLVAGGTATSTMTVFTFSGTLPGSYTITVNGTSGTLSHSVIVSLIVISTISGGGGGHYMLV